MANNWKEPNPYFFWQTEELEKLFAQRAAEGKHIYAFGDSTLHYHLGDPAESTYRVVVFNAKHHGRNHVDKRFRQAGWKEINEKINFSPRVKIYKSLRREPERVDLPDEYDKICVGLGWMDTTKEFGLMILTVVVLQFLLLFMRGRTPHMMEDTLPALIMAFAATSGVMAYKRIVEYLTYKKWQRSPEDVHPDMKRTEQITNGILAVVFVAVIGVMLAHQLAAKQFDHLPAEYAAQMPYSEQLAGESTLQVRKSFLIPEAQLLTVTAEDGSVWTENHYRCLMPVIATQVASDFSQNLMMEDYAESEAAAHTYLYQSSREGDWGVLWFNGSEVITVQAQNAAVGPDAAIKALAH